MMKLNLKNKFIFCIFIFLLNACALTENIGKVPEIFSIQINDASAQKPVKRISKQTIVTLSDFSGNSMISTIRIAVLNKNNRVRYVKDATWVDMPQLMLNQQLNELLQTVDPNLIVANYQERIRSNYLVQGQVMRFYYNDFTKQVDVKIDLKLSHMPEKKLIAQKQFQTLIKIEKDDLLSVMDAFNQASTQILIELQDWIIKSL